MKHFLAFVIASFAMFNVSSIEVQDVLDIQALMREISIPCFSRDRVRHQKRFDFNNECVLASCTSASRKKEEDKNRY